jgi:hypothetical protein
MTLANLKSEIEILTNSRKILIGQIDSLLKTQAQSIHLGHNLASRACELCVLEGKLEEARAMLQDMEGER